MSLFKSLGFGFATTAVGYALVQGPALAQNETVPATAPAHGTKKVAPHPHPPGVADDDHPHDDDPSGSCKKILWKNLPPRISTELPAKLQATVYHPKTDDPPFADAIELKRKSDGHAIPDKELFRDQHLITLGGGKITRTKKGDKETWEFPNGTTFFHRIDYNTIPRKLFELRMVRKVDDHWEFGVYLPSPGNSRELRLATQCEGAVLQLPERKIQLASETVEKSKNEALVKIQRLRPDNCLHCHEMMSPNHKSGQPDDGPCDFGPQTAGIQTWIDEHTASLGNPFKTP